MVHREKPISLDNLTTKSFYNDTPYRHLQLLVINKDI